MFIHICDFLCVNVETTTLLLSSSFKKVNTVVSSGCGIASQHCDSKTRGAF